MTMYLIPFGHGEWQEDDTLPATPQPLPPRRRRFVRADYDQRLVRMTADPMRFVRDVR
jgi:hypothetical protein